MAIEGPAVQPHRITQIERRLAQLGAPVGSGVAAAPLGFGLVLEQERANASAGYQVPAGHQFGLGGGSFTPAIQKTPGSYGPLAPPSELVVFGNGRVPSSALAPVGTTGHTLWAPAARGLETMMAHAAADGVTIGITDSYRSLNEQERLAAEKGLYSQGGLAAVPGTSNHGWGVATDLDLDDAGIAWMRANAWKYGFVEDVPREPWHWTYRPA